MNLFISRANARHQEGDETNNYLRYLSHEDEPIDFYRQNKNDDFAPKWGSNNLLSLFDNSIRHNYWSNLARKFLRNH